VLQICVLPLDFNHAAINDDFGASYKTRIITCKKQNRLRKLDRLAIRFIGITEFR
jgi:hypothetical protein